MLLLNDLVYLINVRCEGECGCTEKNKESIVVIDLSNFEAYSSHALIIQLFKNQPSLLPKFIQIT